MGHKSEVLQIYRNSPPKFFPGCSLQLWQVRKFSIVSDSSHIYILYIESSNLRP